MSATLLFQRALFFLFLLSFFPSWGQHPVFTKVAFPEGVSLPAISAIVQDQQGFIWLASPNGLHRYDGYRFVSYYHDPADKHSLAGNRVETIYISKSGTLWVGTHTNGLDRFDPLTKTFIHFSHDPKDPASLRDNAVTAILEDRQGILWVGTHGGLHRFHPDSGTFTRYQHNPQDSTSLSNDQVRALYEDRQGTLWVGTGSPWESKPGEGGLNQFNPHSGTFTRYLHDPNNPSTLIDNKVRALFEDSRGTFWVGTLGDGLHTMDREKGTFIRHQHDPLQPSKLSRPPILSRHGIEVNGVTFVHEDVTGTIWIGTFGGGVSRYDPKTDKVTHYLHHPKESMGLQEAGLWCAYTSKEGVLWMGALNRDALYRMDPARAGFDYQPTGANVWAVCEDVSGKVWIATTTGLKVYENKNGNFQPSRAQLAFPSGLQKDSVASILEDSQGMIWMGGLQGLWRLDPQTKALKLYAHDPKVPTSISEGIAFSLYESRDGFLWVGTKKGELNRMDPKTGIFTKFRYKLQNSENISKGPISVLTEDRKGNLWVGRFGGISSMKIDSPTGAYKPYLQDHLITSIREDASGRVWTSSEEHGLYVYDEKKDDFVLYTDRNTGRLIVTGIRGMVHDEQGNLWVSSLRGLFKIDKEGNVISMYGEEVGVNPGAFSWWATHKGRNGKLFIGATTGFYSYYPQKININKHPPQLSLTDFRLMDKSVLPGENSPLHVPVGRAVEMELSHKENIFSFEFTGIHFSNPARNKLFFMLESYDIAWREAAANHTASYYKVPPGKYVFRVKAVSSEGAWSEKALLLLIHPPWWRTFWFYSLCGLTFALLLYVGIRYRISQVRKEEQLLRKEEQLIHEQERQQADFTKKLSEREMQALRAQMNPHFIFNSLNSINRFILKNEAEAASDYLSKFSRLIRLILQNSNAPTVTVENELEALELYLVMEALRFEGKFTFLIHCEEEVEVAYVEIPPLLIQPYVENAIWHGLMHKEEVGHISIHVQQEEGFLVCSIEDDGVGRKRAEELKSKSATKKKSLGMQITAHRLELLNQIQGKQTKVEIVDLVDPGGEACGTRVVLKIPI